MMEFERMRPRAAVEDGATGTIRLWTFLREHQPHRSELFGVSHVFSFLVQPRPMCSVTLWQARFQLAQGQVEGLDQFGLVADSSDGGCQQGTSAGKQQGAPLLLGFRGEAQAHAAVAHEVVGDAARQVPFVFQDRLDSQHGVSGDLFQDFAVLLPGIGHGRMAVGFELRQALRLAVVGRQHVV